MELEDWNELAAIRADLKATLDRIDALLSKRPELPPSKRLGEQDVFEIRYRHATNGESVTKLATEYGVDKSTISRLVRLKSHKRL